VVRCLSLDFPGFAGSSDCLRKGTVKGFVLTIDVFDDRKDLTVSGTGLSSGSGGFVFRRRLGADEPSKLKKSVFAHKSTHL